MPKQPLDKTLHPNELGAIKSFLTPEEQNTLDAASKSARDTPSLFQDRTTARTERIVSKLLEHVAKGNQAKVEELLKKYPEYLLMRGNVTDLTGREFIGISAFEYALWAMDSHMYKMMERCIPEGEASIELRAELRAQYTRITRDGVDYTLNGVRVHECHFDYEELKTAYQTYIANYNTWTDAQRDTHWCTQIGGAQSRLPMHVVNEFCRPDRAFYPLTATSFKEDELPRVSKFYNYVANAEQDWVPRDGAFPNKVGSEFGILRGSRLRFAAGGRPRDATADCAAVTALCEVRTADLVGLKERLGLRPPQDPDEEQRRCVIS